MNVLLNFQSDDDPNLSSVGFHPPAPSLPPVATTIATPAHQYLVHHDPDSFTEIGERMTALKLSSSSVERFSNSMALEVLIWNKETTLSRYAEFKGLDLENDVKMLSNNIRRFECVMSLFVIDGGNKSFSIVFTPYPPRQKT